MTTNSGRLWRRVLLGAAAVVLLIVGVLIGVLVAGGDDDDGDTDDVVASQDDTTTTTGPVDESTGTTVALPPVEGATPEAQELIDVIEQGQSAVYTARYQTVDESSGFGALTVDVWRDGDRLRQDAIVEVQGRTVESAAFAEGGQVIACQRGTGGPDWQCREVPPEQAPNVNDRVREAVAELADTVTGGTPATIAGQASRCYALVDADDVPVELCVTEQGVPARFVSGGSSVELLSYAEGVPDGIFEPPA